MASRCNRLTVAPIFMMVLRLPPACHSELELDKVYPVDEDRNRDVILLVVESFNN